MVIPTYHAGISRFTYQLQIRQSNPEALQGGVSFGLVLLNRPAQRFISLPQQITVVPYNFQSGFRPDNGCQCFGLQRLDAVAILAALSVRAGPGRRILIACAVQQARFHLFVFVHPVVSSDFAPSPKSAAAPGNTALPIGFGRMGDECTSCTRWSYSFFNSKCQHSLSRSSISSAGIFGLPKKNVSSNPHRTCWAVQPMVGCSFHIQNTQHGCLKGSFFFAFINHSPWGHFIGNSRCQQIKKHICHCPPTVFVYNNSAQYRSDHKQNPIGSYAIHGRPLHAADRLHPRRFNCNYNFPGKYIAQNILPWLGCITCQLYDLFPGIAVCFKSQVRITPRTRDQNMLIHQTCFVAYFKASAIFAICSIEHMQIPKYIRI